MVFISFIIKFLLRLLSQAEWGKMKIFFSCLNLSMLINSPTVATHKFKNPEMCYTNWKLFTKNKFNELPQLWVF